MTGGTLLPYFSQLEGRSVVSWQGRVTQVVGNLVESSGPPCCLGECCEIRDCRGHVYAGEVVGFRGSTVLTMPLEKPSGIRYGDAIYARGERPSLAVGDDLLGRVIDGAGQPLDGLGPYSARQRRALDGAASGCSGSTAHSRAAGLRCSRHRCIPHLRTRTAIGHLWWQWRRQKHVDRHDDAG